MLITTKTQGQQEEMGKPLIFSGSCLFPSLCLGVLYVVNVAQALANVLIRPSGLRPQARGLGYNSVPWC
jgi:hypothetical protein